MEKITGKPLDIIAFLMAQEDKSQVYDLTPHKEKRSLSQNAYFHRLVGLLAEGETAKFFRKKNELIMQYGVHDFLRDKAGNLIIEYLPDNDDYKDHETKHYFPTQYGGEVQGVIVRAFLLLIGTHEYKANEMVHLIDCTRAECIGCGIPMSEIETLDEKRMMEELRRTANAQAHKSSGNNTGSKTSS